MWYPNRGIAPLPLLLQTPLQYIALSIPVRVTATVWAPVVFVLSL